MSNTLFVVILSLLAIIFVSRNKIAGALKYYLGVVIKPSTIMTVVTVVLTVVLVISMVFSDTKEHYSKISDNYESLQPAGDKKPHRYFDINTYW